jgi:hypothetical protein
LAKALRYYDIHLERSIRDDVLVPSLYWVVVRGLVLGSFQAYRGLVLLLTEHNKPTLSGQARVLGRTILEALGNVMALAEDAKKLKLFLRDGYKNDYRRYSREEDRHGMDPKFRRWLDGYRLTILPRMAKWAELTTEEANDPETYIREEWPTPRRLRLGYEVGKWTSPKGIKHPKRKVPPFLSGERLKVFELLYGESYGGASALAHQRNEAIRVAYFTDDPDSHWSPGRAESNAAIDGIILCACLLAELEDMSGIPGTIHLRVLWDRLEPLHDTARDLLAMRYRELLGLPERVAAGVAVP